MDPQETNKNSLATVGFEAMIFVNKRVHVLSTSSWMRATLPNHFEVTLK